MSTKKYLSLLASERSERDTLSPSSIENAIRIYIYIYVYVIARVGVKFGINFTSVRLSGNKIARGEAECYLPLNLTRVKFVPEISRLTVLLKINTIASLLFILKCTGTLFARSPITYISYFYCLNLIASRSLAKYSKLSIDLPLTKLLDDHKSLTKTIR